jgi:hypothetical protein
MSSPASVKKHPLHPMLVAVPIGLWVLALVCDIVAVVGGGSEWTMVARYCVACGLVGAVIAAGLGLIDYFSIDEAATKRIATLHLAVKYGRSRRLRDQPVVAFFLGTRQPCSFDRVDSRCHCYRRRRLARRRDGVCQRHNCGGG